MKDFFSFSTRDFGSVFCAFVLTSFDMTSLVFYVRGAEIVMSRGKDDSVFIRTFYDFTTLMTVMSTMSSVGR